MRPHSQLWVAFLAVVMLGPVQTSLADWWHKDALSARSVYWLSPDYKTDEFCVPGVGMHYLDLTKPVYGNPQAGFDSNGDLLFFQYLFRAADFNQQVMAGLFSNLKTHKYAKTQRVKISYGQAPAQFIPPQYRDIVCNPNKPDSNLCEPHYDVTFFLVKDQRLKQACDGSDEVTRHPDPRDEEWKKKKS